MENNNKISQIKKYFLINQTIIFLLILIIIVSILTYLRVNIQIILGPGWDTYDFLLNALEFAGKGFGYYDLSRPPFLSFLTGIGFLIFGISESIIFILDGILFIFGAIGFYLLLKLFFRPSISFLGSLLFIFNPLILQWATIGYSDIASLSLLIWAVYFLFFGSKNNSNQVYISALFLGLSFLTRYSSALIIFPFFLFFLMEKPKYKFSDILKYIFVFILTIIPFLLFFYIKFGNPLPFLVTFNVTTVSAVETYWAYNSDIFYYITNFNSFMSVYQLPGGLALLSLIIMGFLTSIFNNMEKIKKEFKSALNINRINVFLILSLTLLLVFILSFNRLPYVLSQIIFIIFCYSTYNILRTFEINSKANLFFLAWVMVFFIFHSIFEIKVERYFITMIPPLIYFVIFGLNSIYVWSKSNLKHCKPIYYFTIILIFLLTILPANIWIINNYESVISSPEKFSYVSEALYGSDWIKDNVPEYKEKIIYSDFLWPHFSWYLQMEVKPFLIENKSFFIKKLGENEVDVFLSSNLNDDLENYIILESKGNLTIYAKELK
ncbi:MAG: glycosyltransferase family 39 protein [Euryarchaeota archaeon]